MLKHNISWKDLKICTQECSNDDFGLTCDFFFCFVFFYGKVKYAWVEFMGFVEDFSAKVNKYS